MAVVMDTRFSLANTVADVLANGGITIHAATGDQPKSGWAVSIMKHRERVCPVEDFNERRLADFLLCNESMLHNFGDMYLGCWIDGGLVYMDCTAVMADKGEALALAAEHDQLAITNLATLDTVYVNQPVEQAA